MNNSTSLRAQPSAPSATLTAMRDVYRGFFDITHNSLAMLGMLIAVGLIVLGARADLRQDIEAQLLTWLQQRQATPVSTELAEVYEPEPEAIQRVTASSPNALPVHQARVTHWLSRKYRVAPEPLSVLVAEAFEIGEKARLDPTLILAVMAIESRFNPFAQSPVGAQGLMQVLTRVHTEKYEDFGGQLAAFDPVTNLRVGAQVLRDCIRRAGSVEGGLRLYVGAVTTDGSDYINKVMAEHLRLQSVALGQPVPTTFPVFRAPSLEAAADATPETGAPTSADATAPGVEAPEPAVTLETVQLEEGRINATQAQPPASPSELRS